MKTEMVLFRCNKILCADLKSFCFYFGRQVSSFLDQKDLEYPHSVTISVPRNNEAVHLGLKFPG